MVDKRPRGYFEVVQLLKMSEMASETVPSDLLHYVYTYLVQCNFQKAAKALQKATDTVS